MVAGARAELEAAQASLDDLFRHDAGAALAQWFADDAQLLWPEEPRIIGPQAIGQAFAEFAAIFETIAYEPAYDLLEVMPPLGVLVGTFVETRRSRAEGTVERVHGRIAYAWRLGVDGWRCTRAMTSRYAPTEVLS